MEIPFDTSSNTAFASDLKDTLGFVDSDIALRKIKPDLDAAAYDLVKTIGQSTYDALIVNKNLNIEGSQNAIAPYQDEMLTGYFKYAIGSMAWVDHASASDLAHTPNGRRMRSSDDEKTPFEWMLARDDDNLQKRSYKAIDVLINYMDNNFDVWKASTSFTKSHELFVRTTEDFSQFYTLESRLLLIKLRPGLSMCESYEIIPRIGQELYESLKTKKAQPETLSADEKKMIFLIQKSSAYSSLSYGLPRLQVNLFPEGILQSIRSDRSTVKARQVPQFLEIKQVADLFKKDADNSLLEVESHYKKMFPPAIITPTETATISNPYGFDENDTFVNT